MIADDESEGMGSSYGFYCEYQGRCRTIEQAGRLFS